MEQNHHCKFPRVVCQRFGFTMYQRACRFHFGAFHQRSSQLFSLMGSKATHASQAQNARLYIILNCHLVFSVPNDHFIFPVWLQWWMYAFTYCQCGLWHFTLHHFRNRKSNEERGSVMFLCFRKSFFDNTSNLVNRRWCVVFDTLPPSVDRKYYDWWSHGSVFCWYFQSIILYVHRSVWKCQSTFLK